MNYPSMYSIVLRRAYVRVRVMCNFPANEASSPVASLARFQSQLSRQMCPIAPYPASPSSPATATVTDPDRESIHPNS